MKLCWQNRLYSQSNEEAWEGLIPASCTALHLLSCFSLCQTIKSFSHIPLELDCFGNLPVFYALRYKRRTMCEFLLSLPQVHDRDYFSSRRGWTYLGMAASHDWGDVIEILISLGCDHTYKPRKGEAGPFHTAAALGHNSALRALLKSNVDVDQRDDDSDTALILATEHKHLRSVRTLLEHKARVTLKGWQGLTALHHAVVTGDIGIVKEICNYDPDVNAAAGRDWGFRTPLHLAAEDNHPGIVSFLLDRKANFDATCANGFTALHLSANTGASNCVALLIKAGAKLDIRDDFGRNAIHLAASNGHIEVVQRICQANKGMVDITDKDGNTPLHDSITANQVSVAMELLKHGASTDLPNSNGHTALSLAIIEGNIEMANRLILDYKANTMKGKVGKPPALHYAAWYGHDVLINPLIISKDANPEAVDGLGRRAIHLAAEKGNLSFIKNLKAQVPSLNLNPLDEHGRSPLYFAAETGAIETVAYFLEHKVEITPSTNKSLPLHIACANGHMEVAELLANTENVNTPGFLGRTSLSDAALSGNLLLVKFLVDLGAELDSMDVNGNTPLLLSLFRKHLGVATFLLDQGADPMIGNKTGHTPLHLAAFHGLPDLVSALLCRRCPGFVLDNYNRTPLANAVLSAKIEVVKLFFDYGINATHVVDSWGATVFAIAAGKGNWEILELLINKGKEVDADPLQENSLGMNVLNYGAQSGDVELLDRLFSLGPEIDGPEFQLRTPLCEATFHGHYDFACALLEHGANVDKSSSLDLRTPLMWAVLACKKRLTRLMVEKGADCYVRDAVGLNAFDYAYQNEDIWDEVGFKKESYTAPDPRERCKVVQSTIKRYLLSLLEIPQQPNNKERARRLMFLMGLKNALLALATTSGQEMALVILGELLNQRNTAICLSRECNMCSQYQHEGSMFQCKSCLFYIVCERCHSDYVKGDKLAKTAPASLRILEKLEEQMQKVREAIAPVVKKGVQFVTSVIDLNERVSDEMVKKANEYEVWGKEYNSDNRYQNYPTPGMKLLDLIKRTREIKTEVNLEENGLNTDEEEHEQQLLITFPDDGPSGEVISPLRLRESVFEKLNEELSKLFKEHRADKDSGRFTCSGHDYLFVPYVDWAKRQPDLELYYDAEGMVKRQWLQNLYDKFCEDKTEETPVLYSEPLEIESETTSRNYISTLTGVSPHSGGVPKRTLSNAESDQYTSQPKTGAFFSGAETLESAVGVEGRFATTGDFERVLETRAKFEHSRSEDSHEIEDQMLSAISKNDAEAEAQLNCEQDENSPPLTTDQPSEDSSQTVETVPSAATETLGGVSDDNRFDDLWEIFLTMVKYRVTLVSQLAALPNELWGKSSQSAEYVRGRNDTASQKGQSNWDLCNTEQGKRFAGKAEKT